MCRLSPLSTCTALVFTPHSRAIDWPMAPSHLATLPATRTLWLAIVRGCQPYLSASDRQIHPLKWRDLLPHRLPWPLRPHRIEDGAGTCSSAFWQRRRGSDCFKPLRTAWLRCFSQPSIDSAPVKPYNSASKEPPLAHEDLQPFLSDVCSWLGVTDELTWQKLLSVDRGQPFRLNLWHALSLVMSDPDADFFTHLHGGVPLEIGSDIPVCKVLLPPDSTDIPTIPIQHCESAWKSALNNPSVVDDLLQSELQEGWILPVRGGF